MHTAAKNDSTQDKDALVAHLRSSQERFLKAVSNVPEKLATISPSEGAWSVLQVAEHVASAEQLMLKMFQAGTPNPELPDLEKDRMILTKMLDRTERFPAPERVVPTGRYKALSHAVSEFRRTREQTIAEVRAIDQDFRKRCARHPLGVFDGYQYLTIMALHAERHALQIDEIKNSAAYRARLVE